MKAQNRKWNKTIFTNFASLPISKPIQMHNMIEGLVERWLTFLTSMALDMSLNYLESHIHICEIRDKLNFYV